MPSAPVTTLQIPVFTREALALLFARDSFLSFQKDGFASHYWAPLLAAGCGASRNEVFFLYTDDLIMLDGQWWLGLRRVGERNAPVRRVPLHPWLQDLGFVEFVKEQFRIRPQQRLFAEYKAGRENGGMLFSRAFVHWIKTTVAALPVSQQALFIEDYHFPSLRALFWQEVERASLSASTLQLLRGGEGNRSQAAAELGTLPIASCFPALPPYCALARGPEQKKSP